MDGKLGFQFSDPPACRQELGSFPGCQTGFESLIDALLASPVVDRPIANAQIAGDVADRSTGRDQLKNPAAKLRRYPLRPMLSSLWTAAC